MSNDAAFFRRQASTQRDAASDATLSNVRERCERAAASWDAMAARAERTDKLRADRQPIAAPDVEASKGEPAASDLTKAGPIVSAE
ncbi:hypothetical protein [Sphingomonas sp. Mn802worker]|uniref:hypothetical protein n=1 Tax=Sphingomonas sp. Mn802worker TaxID=629773 RepID=UPI000372538F|nr:hypothetical protein [Sphingomonas sp. Mn802worker]